MQFPHFSNSRYAYTPYNIIIILPTNDNAVQTVNNFRNTVVEEASNLINLTSTEPHSVSYQSKVVQKILNESNKTCPESSSNKLAVCRELVPYGVQNLDENIPQMTIDAPELQTKEVTDMPNKNINNTTSRVGGANVKIGQTEAILKPRIDSNNTCPKTRLTSSSNKLVDEIIPNKVKKPGEKIPQSTINTLNHQTQGSTEITEKKIDKSTNLNDCKNVKISSWASNYLHSIGQTTSIGSKSTKINISPARNNRPAEMEIQRESSKSRDIKINLLADRDNRDKEKVPTTDLSKSYKCEIHSKNNLWPLDDKPSKLSHKCTKSNPRSSEHIYSNIPHKSTRHKVEINKKYLNTDHDELLQNMNKIFRTSKSSDSLTDSTNKISSELYNFKDKYVTSRRKYDDLKYEPDNKRVKLDYDNKKNAYRCELDHHHVKIRRNNHKGSIERSFSKSSTSRKDTAASISDDKYSDYSRKKQSNYHSSSKKIAEKINKKSAEKRKNSRSPLAKKIKRTRLNSNGSSSSDLESTNLSPIKNLQKYEPNQKHPRITPPQNESNFDLRHKLSTKNIPKINYPQFTVPNCVPDTQREHIVVTVNNDDESLNTKQPTKSQSKTKKCKKIKLIINVVCKSDGDNSNDSSSSNESNEDEDHNNFLDDFNVDDIVNSLKLSPKKTETDITSNNMSALNKNIHSKDSIRASMDYPSENTFEINTCDQGRLSLAANKDNAQTKLTKVSDLLINQLVINKKELKNNVIKNESNALNIGDSVIATPSDICSLNLEHEIKQTEVDILLTNESCINITEEHNDALNKDDLFITTSGEFLSNLNLEHEIKQTYAREVDILPTNQPCKSNATVKNNALNVANSLISTTSEVFNKHTADTALEHEIIQTDTDKEVILSTNQHYINISLPQIDEQIENLDNHAVQNHESNNCTDQQFENSKFSEKDLNTKVTEIIDLTINDDTEPEENELNRNIFTVEDKILEETINRTELCKDITVENKTLEETYVNTKPMEEPKIVDVSKISLLTMKTVKQNESVITKDENVKNNGKNVAQPTPNINTLDSMSPCKKKDELDSMVLTKRKNELDSVIKLKRKNEDIHSDVVAFNVNDKKQEKLPEGEPEKNNQLKIEAENIKPLKNTADDKPTDIVDCRLSAGNQKELVHKMSQFLEKDLTLSAFIHKGKYSNVFKYSDTSGQSFAVKQTHYGTKGYPMEKIINELKDNLNTVQFFMCFRFHKRYYYVMEYYPQNLEQVVKATSAPFKIDDVQLLARQLVAAVVILKHKNIIHADIKPGHVLLNVNKTCVKICGFDNAYVYNPNYDNRFYYNLEESTLVTMASTGTVNYRAPELLLGFSTGFSIDVWATALVIYEMATNITLFPGKCNNDILFKQMSTVGCPPTDMIDLSYFRNEHFSYGNLFMRRVGYRRLETIMVPEFYKSNRIERTILLAYHQSWGRKKTQALKQKDLNKLHSMKRLLELMLIPDPRQRLSIEFVYTDPFIYERT